MGIVIEIMMAIVMLGHFGRPIPKHRGDSMDTRVLNNDLQNAARKKKAAIWRLLNTL